ncbi:DddA-like double-stranded DNA deaminase toxin [Amycolatopsis thermoflava]|uniref:DddA-like double-stranded DNA deaminase toxin n=1 Tax=Amycolatopsis thermoflava TaxID=84480 RepID=UPI00382514AC
MPFEVAYLRLSNYRVAGRSSTMGLKGVGVDIATLITAIRTARGKLATNSLDQAANLLDEARQLLEQVGSSQPELCQALAGLTEALEKVTSIQALVGRAGVELGIYLERLGPADDRSNAAAPPPRPADPARRAARSSTPDGQRLTREQADAIRAELPPPVVSMSGQKTHGRWIDENGQAHEIVSGRDEDAEEAARMLREKGIPQRGDVTTTADVEQKLAARMVREGRRHLDVVLNNQPCRGLFGCDTLLPVILPEGYSLTVHAPNYQKTFTGGKQPWSR